MPKTLSPSPLAALIASLFCCTLATAEPLTATDSQVNPLADATETAHLYGQFTAVNQWVSGFTSPYQGQNSFKPSDKNAETTDLTLFAGVRIGNGEVWINPEIDQGFGLSNTLGLAGYSSGEAYKVGAYTPYLRLPRLFYRQVFNLGGEAQTIAPAVNQLGHVQTADNLVFTIGKFSVVDIFDTNSYAHDPRADFLNWSVLESGAFDYAADSWGFTKGLALELTKSSWTLRGGLFDLSKMPNSAVLDANYRQTESILEWEQRYQLSDHPGKFKLLAFEMRANIGSYADAVAANPAAPDTASVRHFGTNSGGGINLEQELAADLGVFARFSKNSGKKEAFDFTEINQSISAGLSLKGDRWGRHDDTIGFAAVANNLSSDAISYFAAGGMGILIGDGQLPHYGAEKIAEAYYAYAVPGVEHLQLAVNYQYIVNPAYNRDRGPVSILGVRLHKDF